MRVKNFRTVGAQEQLLDLSRTLTVIGPNNSGKTNLLRSVQMLFTGYDNAHEYNVTEDSPRGKGARTSIVGYFDGDPHGPDVEFYSDLDRLYGMYGLNRPGTIVALYLTFSPSGTPTYNFFPNQKKPNDGAVQSSISRLQRQLVVDLLSRFQCHFIPSEKSMRELVDDVLTPFVHGVVVDVLQPLLGKVESELNKVSTQITRALADSGVDGLSASFGFQGGLIQNMLGSFDFYLSDPYKTLLARKGQGTQSLAFMAALRWVTEKESEFGRRSIWLIEEPESFLHPKLSHNATQLLASLGDASTVIMTSHSMAFVPHDPKKVVGTHIGPDGCTSLETFVSHEKATAALRIGLGLRFADYFSLGTSTVLTEGQSDSEYLRWFLALSAEWEGCEWPSLRRATFSDRGGASQLGGFVRANYEILRNEQPTVSLFDGDEAGLKAVSDVSHYFNNIGVAFNSNREYVYVRSGFAIEGLFPDLWVVEARDANPNHFIEVQTDAAGKLMKVRIKDNSKHSVGNSLKLRAESEVDQTWASMWSTVCAALDGALRIQADART
ncbi:ATP-dependent endonuclease [Cryobacterium sp. TMS1-20-1]|uniref:ATP-dependent nuclease n=1 Tax=Cryobacterium sp. TMS1-20-1 TaxID=1259223 RepID=UPI00141BE5D1|nr:AAA family ATPase [Cryobacterium sp. TMS1-20-1]